MKKLQTILSLVFIAGTLFLTRCDEIKDNCPNDMVGCNVNGDVICVPKDIGC